MNDELHVDVPSENGSCTLSVHHQPETDLIEVELYDQNNPDDPNNVLIVDLQPERAVWIFETIAQKIRETLS